MRFSLGSIAGSLSLIHIFGVDRGGHVAVEADEVVFARRGVLVKHLEDRIVLVHVVDHREKDLFLRGVERGHLVRLVLENVGAEAFAENEDVYKRQAGTPS